MHGAVEVPGRVEDDLSRFQNEGHPLPSLIPQYITVWVRYDRMIVFETEMKQHAENGQWYEAWLVSIT